MTKAKNKKNNKSLDLKIVVGTKGILLSSIFVFLAIVWAFILGVIVGRGYGPIDLLSFSFDRVKGKKLEEKQKKDVAKIINPTELTFYEKVKQDTGERFIQEKNNRRFTSASSSKETKDVYTYLLQVSSFRSKKDALLFSNELKKNNFSSWVEKVVVNKREWFRVYVKISGNSYKLNSYIRKLKELGIDHVIIKEKKKLQ